MKKAVFPAYGKRGMGWVNNPKKAAYNHVYNRTTKSVVTEHKGGSGGKPSNSAMGCVAIAWAIAIIPAVLIFMTLCSAMRH